MKLKNKLLPLVGVATACAAVAPIALTSCKSNSNDWIDLTQKYSPTVKALDNQTCTTAEANEKYFGKEGAWVSDEDVIARFKDDFFWSLYNSEDDNEYTEAKVKFDYLYVNHVTFTPSSIWSGTTKDPYKIVTLTYKVEFSGTRTRSSSEYSNTTTYNVVNTVTNMPFAVWFQDISEDPVWMVAQDTKLIADNDFSTAPIAWSFNEKMDYTTTISFPEYGYETTNTYSTESVCYTKCLTDESGETEQEKHENTEENYADFFGDLNSPLGGKSHYMFSVQNGD